MIKALWHGVLTLILLTWRIGWADNAIKWQMGLNSVFKGLIAKKAYLQEASNG
jgi:hypothetical protein